MKTVIAAISSLTIALVLILGGAFGVAALSPCTSGMIDPQQASRLQPIAGYQGAQFAYAATILNTITTADADERAATIAVSAAIARSGLRNLDTTSDVQAGIYLLGPAFGTAAERLDPSTATLRFLATLTATPGWLTLRPADAAAAAIPGSTAASYQTTYADAAAIVQALRATEVTCSVSDDPVALATELVAAADAGQLRGLAPDHIKEIRWIAQGRTVPGCGIDTRVLQILVVAVRNFDQVLISDINRRCTGQIAGAGTASAHYAGGGGRAVDFAGLNGRALTGGDSLSIQLINLLDPLVPNGSRIGQIECRARAGIRLAPANFTQFFGDTCNHLHVDVAYADDDALILGQ